MEKRIVGKIIFLNKGKKLSLPLKYKNLQKVIGKKSVLTNAEAVFLGKEEGDEFSERLYEKVSKQGLSFIRIMPYVQNDNINQNEFLLTISLSDSLSKEDADNIKEEVNKISSSLSPINCNILFLVLSLTTILIYIKLLYAKKYYSYY